MELPIYFVSGLPRSGSTLLMNLLGQNPNHHVTPTSGMIEIFANVRANWKNYIEFRAEGLEKVKPRIKGVLKGIIQGFFEEEFKEGKTVFDKSRGWFQYIENVEEVLGRPIKVLVTIRDIRAIVASFEKIYRNRGIEFDYPLGDAFFKCQSIEGRCEHLLSPGGVVGVTVARLRDALSRGVGSRLVIVPYNTLTKHPKSTLEHITNVLELKPFNYDPDNVQQITHEDDIWHGMSLHIVKSPVTPAEVHPWQEILPSAYAKDIDKRYSDINKLCNQ